MKDAANPDVARQLGRPRGLRFELRIWLATLAILLPALGLAAFLLWRGDWPLWQRWSLGIGSLLLSVYAARRLHRMVVHPLLTLANLLEALRAGDYSLRGVEARRGDALGEVLWEVNALSHTLREERLKVEETHALLSKVLASVDIAIFAFDDARRLRLLNAAGERLLARSAADSLGRSALELGLEACCESDTPATLKHAFPGGSGSFDLRRTSFREGGRPHELIAITDLSRALREEERQAWQRLIRVLGHELNNSLTPIKSMTATLRTIVAREPLAADWREDVQGGLSVMGERAEALTRFMGRYTQLARLPPPVKRSTALAPLLSRVCRFEQRLPVELREVPDIQLDIDSDQIEQALINLVKNAVEAAQSTAGGVRVRVEASATQVAILVEDEGTGLAKTDNLFVPFFTTKPGGSGVGLVLARQIVENHGGSLDLSNRQDTRGAIATVLLPVRGQE